MSNKNDRSNKASCDEDIHEVDCDDLSLVDEILGKVARRQEREREQQQLQKVEPQDDAMKLMKRSSCEAVPTAAAAAANAAANATATSTPCDGPGRDTPLTAPASRGVSSATTRSDADLTLPGAYAHAPDSIVQRPSICFTSFVHASSAFASSSSDGSSRDDLSEEIQEERTQEPPDLEQAVSSRTQATTQVNTNDGSSAAATTMIRATSSSSGHQEGQDEKLVEANLVAEDEHPQNVQRLPQARPSLLNVRPQARRTPEQVYKAGRTKVALLFVLGCLLIIVICVVSITVGQRSQSSVVTTAPSEGPPSAVIPPLFNDTQTNDASLFPLEHLFESTVLAIQSDPASPQAKALEWILQDPSLRYYPTWRRQQRFALATLYYATQGDQWTNTSGWLSYDRHECAWASKGGFGLDFLNDRERLVNTTFDFIYGMQTEDGMAPLIKFVQEVYQESPTLCNDDDAYTSLFLFDNNLQGTLPDEIYMLTSLRSLDLSSNSVGGTISSAVGKLSDLECFWMGQKVDDHNQLRGTLPTEFARLRRLKVLRIFRSNMDGAIPSELGELSDSLTYLGLSIAGHKGTIPTELGHLQALAFLTLMRNTFTGPLPTELGQLEQLQVLYLERNLLTASIPSEVGNVSMLKMLSISNNQLTSTIPSSLGSIRDLMTLDVQSNHLTGNVPLELNHEHLPWLVQLRLDDNPALFGTVQGLVSLDCDVLTFANTSLTGQVPSDVCNATSELAFTCSPSLCGCTCPCDNTTSVP